MWDARYAEPGFAYGTAPNDFLAAHHAAIPKGAVLCLAEGEGRNGVFLAERGYDVTGVDSSAVGLAKAQALATERGVALTTVVADLATWDIAPGAWDGVVSVFAHLPPPLRQRVHRQVVAGLRPGGVLLLEAYTPAQLAFGTGGPPVATMMMTLDGLRDELGGLEFLHAVELEREVHEGAHHNGRSAVVQVLARKPA